MKDPGSPDDPPLETEAGSVESEPTVANVIAFPRSEPAEESAAEPADARVCPPELLVPALEACLFAVAEPQSIGALAGVLGVEPGRIRAALEALRERQMSSGSGIRLVEVGEGWQLRTEARLAGWVTAVRGGRPVRLSKSALETLAVVAFRQPVAKGAVDDIRGVDSGGILRALLDRGLVKLAGRSEEPGRPMLYATTPAFLTLFGMLSLADLPTLRDLRTMVDDDPEAAVVAVVPFPDDDDGKDVE